MRTFGSTSPHKPIGAIKAANAKKRNASMASSHPMHDANALGFTKRRRGIGIIGAEKVWPGGQPSTWVGTAKSATLHHGDETVTVENIRRGGMGGAFIGTICGFARTWNVKYGGMQIGDTVAFQEEHVFTIEA